MLKNMQAARNNNERPGGRDRGPEPEGCSAVGVVRGDDLISFQRSTEHRAQSMEHGGAESRRARD